MEVKRSITSHGRKSIMCGGYTLSFQRKNRKGGISWRCTIRRCPATVHTDDDVTRVIKLGNEHSHAPNCRHMDDSYARRKRRLRRIAQKSLAPDVVDYILSLKPEHVATKSTKQAMAFIQVEKAKEALKRARTETVTDERRVASARTSQPADTLDMHVELGDSLQDVEKDPR